MFALDTRQSLSIILVVSATTLVACGGEELVTLTPQPVVQTKLTLPDAGNSKSTESTSVDAGWAIASSGDPSNPDAGTVSLGSGPPYPFVLMHGMGGFNQLENLPVTVSYFSGVQADLIAHGYPQTFVTVTLPYDSSENRAAVLKPQIQAILAQTGAGKVNLIAHSQGGLDARILASPQGFDMGNVIASVTTVATPHLGTPVADVGLGILSPIPSYLVAGVTSAFLQLLEDGVYSVQSDPNLLAQANEMTSSYMINTFNPTYGDAPNVIYSSYAGRTNLETGASDCANALIPNDSNSLDVTQAVLAPTAAAMYVASINSDGLVPIASAKWGTFVQCVPADHLKEVGMLFQSGPDPVSGFDHLVFFESIAARIRGLGL